MKFMKLGSKPDIFQAEGNIRRVATELSSDIVINIEGAKFYLHKFPLMSKSICLQGLVAKSCESENDELDLPDFPGGPAAFEICAKFCYGIVVTLNAYNVLPIRCAAEYLGMTEAIEKGNLIYKIEVFFSSSIFRSWKDSIIVLQTTKLLSPWSEDLKVVGRCIDSIAAKTSVDPAKVDWSFTYTRAKLASDQPCMAKDSSPVWNGNQSRKHRYVPKDWWIEDICELDIDLYQRVMAAIKTKGRMSHELIGEALKVYTLRWLPGVSKDSEVKDAVKNGNGSVSDDYVETAAKHRVLLEAIVNLLPSEKGTTSCSFLLKLLKAATILGAETSSKMELVRRIGLQLEEASLSDLLIPSLSYTNDSLYDVDLVQCILDHFLMQDQSPQASPEKSKLPYERRTRSSENVELSEGRISASATHSSKLSVAKLIDGYLAEIARDAHLPLSKFINLAESISNFARPVHDGLYRAIDIYLKEHPGLSKSEKKKICSLMDCKKLSMDACMHAAQNERLPLRIVVQVLFFEQVRTAMTGGFLLNDLPNSVKALVPPENGSQGSFQSATNPEDEWDAVHDDLKNLRGDLGSMKIRIAEPETEQTNMHQTAVKNIKSRGLFMLPSRSKKILQKLWTNKAHSEFRSSETSGSSASPISVNPVDTKSTASRQRRHSIS
ncbi:BTB/POZ domain-containing protein At1g67900 [Cryptomeria japonica]|uniref:BTB/POZ domain-containing protein At1g67900 n=1 Tax=Cryptomeria japonica TaxID=3369 RepID=UPI0027DA4387|nr:BTB/POZ domain-containing protein At1g67900 [Cryptomeria japonica]